MSYDTAALATKETIAFLDSTFGATTVTHQIMGPRGCVGFVRDVEVDITTSIVGTTTVPEVAIGISSGDATFGRYRLGTAVGTAYTGTGAHRASQLAIIGTGPLRTLADFAGHVVLDGSPYTSIVVAGGTASTQVPSGRIPAGPLDIVNVINGSANVVRAFTKQVIDPLVKVGQTVWVEGIGGATGAAGQLVISAIGTNRDWMEFTGTTFGGTFTAGGLISFIVFISNVAGVGGTPAGGGHVRVRFDWEGLSYFK